MLLSVEVEIQYLFKYFVLPEHLPSILYQSSFSYRQFIVLKGCIQRDDDEWLGSGSGSKSGSGIGVELH